MRSRLIGTLIALALLLAGCSSLSAPDSSSGPSDTSSYSSASDPETAPAPEPTTDPATDIVSEPPVEEDTKPPVEETEPAAPTGIPDVPAGAPARCTFALKALEAAGADTLEPDAKPVKKALTACRNVEQWVGGLYTVPGALGYTSASELNDQTLTNDLQVLCGGELRTPTCKDARKRGLLD